MKKVATHLLASVVIFVCTISAPAQTMTTAHGIDNTRPSYDMKAQSLLDLKLMQKKFVDLAQVIPEEKLNWRPSAASRSYAEVLLHVAGERYGILALMGSAPPAGFNAKTYEKSTTNRDQIIKELEKSWDFTQNTISGMSNAEFAKLIPKLGPEANAGDVVYILVADAHEHLGQCVAYAREIGIVPPWTIQAQQREAANKAKQK
ncbi:MAG: DinB family protein [Candidatus Sulfotelmatobacter sp.]